MPDSTWSTVSASQIAALFNQSPYTTKFSIWHAFRNRDRSLIESADNDRMSWGRRLQPLILAATAEEFNLDVVENVTDAYNRAGRLGCTIDGSARITGPGIGEVLVEAKNVAWDVWKDSWNDTTAPPHIELQVQAQMLVRGCPETIIAVLVGGNEMHWIRRKSDPEIWQQLWKAADEFFESLEYGIEPAPFGSPLELPTLARLYTEADPDEVLNCPDDDELAEAIRSFEWARDQVAFATKLQDQSKAKFLARAGTAGVIRAPGVTAFISRSAVSPTVCQPHAEMKVTRKASVQTRVKVIATEDTRSKPEQGIAA